MVGKVSGSTDGRIKKRLEKNILINVREINILRVKSLFDFTFSIGK